MGERLQNQILERLEQDPGISGGIENLVLAAVMGQIEECLGGSTPPRPGPAASEAMEPERAFLGSVHVEGFRGIGGPVELPLTPGAGLTLVVGRNGSGKSSFAEALELLLTGDNQRWSSKGAKIWKDGWRNLHHGAGTRISAELVLEGRKGSHRITRRWRTDDELDDGAAEVSRDGAVEPLATLGWTQALTTYRPFLSYNELGSMLDEGPAKLFDALASILGLEDLVAAADALKAARLERERAHKVVKAQHKELRGALSEHEDERASDCAAAMAGTKWKLDEIERLASPGAAAETGSELQVLREIEGLAAASPESVRDRAQELRIAVDAVTRVEGTDAARARRRASLLEQALELHRHDGDGSCPVCGREAALHADWRRGAEAEASSLRSEAEAADLAHHRLDRAERSARELVSDPPRVLDRAESVGLDAKDSKRAWDVWGGSSSLAGVALAEALEARAPALADSVGALSRGARSMLDEREDRWRPMARRIMDWLPGARRLAEESDTIKELKKAEDWVRKTGVELRNERFEPIKKDVLAAWQTLRSRSNVELADVTFEGRATTRRVSLDVTVDGTEGAALGVMSQGELHALALALFLPRATLDKSPFRFLVIDDPVQSMDPARVDGLARVLADRAVDRQVVVFTHDERLPEAVRRLRAPARVIQVLRREGSQVELRPVDDPVEQHLSDARALARTRDLPKIARERVTPGLCRKAIEAACLETVRRRRLGRGETHESIEELFETHAKLVPRLALALFDDPDRGGEVMSRVSSQFGRREADAVAECNRGSHEGFGGDDAIQFVRDVERLAKAIAGLKT